MLAGALEAVSQLVTHACEGLPTASTPMHGWAEAFVWSHSACLWLQDIFTLFYLDRPFKFVSKTSNFLIPIVGWSMFLTGTPWPVQPGPASLSACLRT